MGEYPQERGGKGASILGEGYQVIGSFRASLLSQGASLVSQMVKNLPAEREIGFKPWVGMIPWRIEWLPTPAFLPEEFHGQKSLVGYSQWGSKESDMNEQLTLSLFHRALLLSPRTTESWD